ELIDNTNEVEDVLYIVKNNKLLTIKNIDKFFNKINNKNEFEIEQGINKVVFNKTENISFLTKLEKYLDIYYKREKIRDLISSYTTLFFLIIIFLAIIIPVYNIELRNSLNYINNFFENNQILTILLPILLTVIGSFLLNTLQKSYLDSAKINTNIEFIIAILKDKIENFNNNSHKVTRYRKIYNRNKK
ncbi:hypothetical protein HZY83_07110, partial [Gemella sp. GH3]|uniref:hypothetical protein n=1 Tax=unclassified Gemella TaxID=2624949 RepID=UPI0015D044BF